MTSRTSLTVTRLNVHGPAERGEIQYSVLDSDMIKKYLRTLGDFRSKTIIRTEGKVSIVVYLFVCCEHIVCVTLSFYSKPQISV